MSHRNLYLRRLYPLNNESWFISQNIFILVNLVAKDSLVPFTTLHEGLGTRSQTLFLSNWFNWSWFARDECSSMRASSTYFVSIWETKDIKLHTRLREWRVVTPLEISIITFWIGWSLLVLLSWEDPEGLC